MAQLDPDVGAIEACTTEANLRLVFQRIIENYGFASYGFIDASRSWQSDPLLVTTHDAKWIDTYKREDFLEFDPCLSAAMRTNTPFSWSSIALPKAKGNRKPGALRTMEAAKDFGINEGLTIPFHYNDPLGRRYTSVCALFWKDNVSSFQLTLREKAVSLHFLLIYFAQKMVDLHGVKIGQASTRKMYAEHHDRHPLTDREKEVLKWAGLGKTASETADILHCSRKTVEIHVQNAVSKLSANNKTHAALIAAQFGLINV